MRLTKDEARILGAMLDEAKYDLVHDLQFDTKEQANAATKALTFLGNRLRSFGKDKRRTGRTSLDYFTDVIKRFVAASTKQTSEQ